MAITVLTPKVIGEETKASDANVLIANDQDLDGRIAAATPTLINGSFEQNNGSNTAPTGWTLTALPSGNSCNIENSAANTAHGSQAFSGTTPGSVSGGVVISQSAKSQCTPLRTFHLRWLLKSSVANVTNNVKVNWFTNAGAVVSTTTVWTENSANPTAWTAYIAPVTPPATAQFWTLQIELVNSATAGTSYIDGIEALSVASGQRVAVFTSSGNFIWPADCQGIYVEALGGGGSGGGGGAWNGSGVAAQNGNAGGNSYVYSATYAARGGNAGIGGSGASSGTVGPPATLNPIINTYGINFGSPGLSAAIGTMTSGGSVAAGTYFFQQPPLAGGAEGSTNGANGNPGATNTGQAGSGGGGGNSVSGSAGNNGEYAQFYLSLTLLGVSVISAAIQVVVGAGGSVTPGNGTGGKTGGNSGAGGSGLVIIYY